MASRHSSSGAHSHSRPHSHSGHERKKSGKKAHLKLVGGTKHRAAVRRTRLANIGALAAGAAGVAAASATGVGELAVGLFSAYVVYRVIRYGVAPSEAIIEGVELEHGEAPRTESNAA